jgi:hypothetical protein
MDDAIRKALEAAGEAVRQSLIKPPCCMEGTGCELPPCHCSSVAAAAAIAAFLEALPPVDVMMAQRPHDPVDPGGPHSTGTLAAAVRRAAGGG